MAERLDKSKLRDDLKSTLRTRQELGEEMEDEIIESFLSRLDQSITEMVDARVAEAKTKRRSYITWPRILVLMAFALLIIAVAGVTAGLGGIIAVAALVVIIPIIVIVLGILLTL